MRAFARTVLARPSCLPHSLHVRLTSGRGERPKCGFCSTAEAAEVAQKAPGDSKEFSHTLQLPKTAFDIRANSAHRDKIFYSRTCSTLYNWQRGRKHATGDFVFHDGPPYANGNLHCGHALNKVLKDISNRYQVLQGKRVHYMPGWDCHGLPIEAKALAHFPAAERDQLSATDIRRRARKEALKAIKTQMREFQKFGIMADWSEQTTYRTLDPKYEGRQLRVFGEMVRKGLIYRQYKPVYWSPSNRTALAESELEYREDHQSKAVYVAFDLVPGARLKELIGDRVKPHVPLKAIIWTTTPWSLPSNMAICVHPDMEYSVVRRDHVSHEMYVIATERLEAISQMKSSLDHAPDPEAVIGPLTEIIRLRGSDLLGTEYTSPLAKAGGPARPVLMADYVTSQSGTGLVHSAPAHGAEDYQVWREHGMLKKGPIFSPVDELGCYNNDLIELDSGLSGDESQSVSSRLVGKDVMTVGASEVITILKERSALVSMHTLRHKYPYDWRSKQPVLVRATAQWFANLDKIKADALQALENVTFVPPSSRARLEAFIRGRSEWCISRQRVWGVPIPVLYDKATDEPLITVDNIEHIASILEVKGTDHWWEADADELVAPQYRQADKEWRKGEDTIDVWFDSGTSWATLRADLQTTTATPSPNDAAQADVYLEGSDQHRGWFQSSLITAVASTPDGQKPVAPYRTLVTHGYVLDTESRKMSKSLGNVVSPLSIIEGGKNASEPAYGIDVLRLWVARTDYTTDPPIGNLIISKTAETLRKLRNTARFMLANLPAQSTIVKLDKTQMTLLDRCVMHELQHLEVSCKQAYDAYDFAQVVRRMTDFTNGTLSNLYLDIAKDCLYVDSVNSTRRRMMVAVVDQVLRTFTSILAPIVPLLAEEIHHYRQGATRDPEVDADDASSVFAEGWQCVSAAWSDSEASTDMTALLRLRNVALAVIEQARKASRIKTSFEVEVDLILDSPQTSDLSAIAIADKYRDELTQLFNVAKVIVRTDGTTVSSDWSLQESSQGVTVSVRPSTRFKCTRCRTFRKENEEDRLCQRCHEVVNSM